MAKKKAAKKRTVKRKTSSSSKLKVTLKGKGLRLPHGYQLVKTKKRSTKKKK